MAGDWIKVRCNLASDPDVIQMAAALGLDEFGVVGRLHAVWSWLDSHSDDGTSVRIVSAFLDRLTACPGFAEALRAVGWLAGRDGALDFPGYTEHNGETAKRRAIEAKRKQSSRSRDKCPQNSGTNVPPETGHSPGQNADQRREDNVHTPREPDPPMDRPGEVPTLEKWKAECERYLIPDWYAERKYGDFATKGWKTGNTTVVWRDAVRFWVKRDFENDGRPMNPPANGGKPSKPKTVTL